MGSVGISVIMVSEENTTLWCVLFFSSDSGLSNWGILCVCVCVVYVVCMCGVCVVSSYQNVFKIKEVWS